MKKLKGRKLLTTLLLVMALCCTSLFGISAIATETTKVGKVKINVTNDNRRVKFSSAEEEKYTVTNPTGEISVSVGDSNVDFEVTIKAKDGYYFDGISKGDVSFKKDSSGVKCTDVSYNSQEIRADIEVKTIKGKLEKPDSAWWDDDDFGVAYWDDYYYDNYDYGVRPDGRPQNYGWISYNGKWFFTNSDEKIKTVWLEDNSHKYYLNKDGEMLTGWQKNNIGWYYYWTDGSKAINTIIWFNGYQYRLDKNGRWIR